MNDLITWARLARMYRQCGMTPITAAKRAARRVWRRDHL